jgi:SAM-dependent methyltransferase
MTTTAMQDGGPVIETRPERTRYHKDVAALEVDHPWFRILEQVPAGARLLDVGCGSGELGSVLATRAAHVDGLEVNAERAESARLHLRRVVTGSAGPSADQALDDDYDVIVFADVIEHIAYPEPTLRWAVTKLAPAGRIIALIPNSANWKFRRKIIRGDWSYEETGYFDRDHVRFFDIRTTRDLGLRCGLTEIHLDYVPERLPKPVNTWKAGAAIAARKRPNLFASHTLVVWQARSGS